MPDRFAEMVWEDPMALVKSGNKYHWYVAPAILVSKVTEFPVQMLVSFPNSNGSALKISTLSEKVADSEQELETVKVTLYFPGVT